MGARGLGIIAALLAACYSPSLRDCEVTCASGSCPAGFTCEAGVCRVEGFAGTCASVMQDGALADDASGDAPNSDTMCSYTCYAQGTSLSPVGSASCRAISNNCQANSTWLDQIDLCGCSVGEPELYLQQTGTTMYNVAIVGPARPTGSTYAMTIDGTTCYGTGPVCPNSALAGCIQSSEVDAWSAITIAPGNHVFRFYNDDGGSGCDGVVLYTFAVIL